jgi:hypothetical protein
MISAIDGGVRNFLFVRSSRTIGLRKLPSRHAIFVRQENA